MYCIDEVYFLREIEKSNGEIITKTLNTISDYLEQDNDEWISLSDCYYRSHYDMPSLTYTSGIHRRILHILAEGCGLITHSILHKNRNPRVTVYAKLHAKCVLGLWEKLA